jgi:nucleotide-binding universal stress UspA family protein
MEKILLAIDPIHTDKNTIAFACFLADLTHSKLTGVFVDEAESEMALVNAAGNNKPVSVQHAESIRLFENGCRNRALRNYIRNDVGIPVKEILAETRFADLLIVAPETSFHAKQESVPGSFVKEVLSKSECPVVVVPCEFSEINEIIFAYDGSASSVFALKQFTYLFPQLADEKMTIVQVNNESDRPIRERERLGELLQANYSCVGHHTLQGDPSNELFRYLSGKKNALVIMGSFGRPTVPGFFRHSTAELILKALNLPVFIAHH